ncbi:MAG: DUF3526 domain-containing protein [Acidobacteriota bacterium]
MIIRIARKEFTEMLRDGRYTWASIIVLVLLFISLVMGWKHYREVNTQHRLAQAETRQQWLRQPAKNPHSAAHYGAYAFKPKLLTAFLDRGVDNYTGVAVWLEAHKQNDFKYRPAQDATAVQRFGELTAATVMQLLIPLLIILFSFGAFVVEREQGTFRQLLSIGVMKTDLALGKVLGISGALGLLLIPATIIGVVALTLTSENGSFAASLPRLALMALSYLLYVGIFVSLSLTVSAKAPSSRLALVILLGFWIANGLIAPRIMADLARRVYPTPSAFEFAQSIEHDLKNGTDGHNPADKRAEELKQYVMKQYNVTKIEDLPVSFAGISLQQGEEDGYIVYDKHYGALWSLFEQQNKLKQLVAVTAPMLAINSISMGLAGTDFAQHRDFAEKAENYRRMFIKMMNEDMIVHAVKEDFSYQASPALWQTVPDFKYNAPGVGWVLRNHIVGVIMLMLWFIAATVALLVAIKKIRVD